MANQSSVDMELSVNNALLLLLAYRTMPYDGYHQAGSCIPPKLVAMTILGFIYGNKVQTRRCET
ncbi:hypothetical protein BOTBODRAFT_28178 [Botryobasidium botryosum FD-172 SS1]|uniref:Uncharacterized protein n=1 Tax=Botryobasidium botryosum (strain FD-172 SS1) TaxID=930990 RepID=A0A067N645_BOTB1|nr:hypothetical protein BOTBODRAFT_28178 [Botryobasidium botryosum FD-172 SS1]